MRNFFKLLAFILVLSLPAGLPLALLGCGPAASAVDEPTPIHALQATAVPTTEPVPSPDPPAPAGAAAEPFIDVERHPLLGSEPVVSAKPAGAFAYEPSYKTVGGDAAIKAGKSDSAGGSGQKASTQNAEYTWQDGDRTLTVLLQDDLTVSGDGRNRTSGRHGHQDGAERHARQGRLGRAAGVPVAVWIANDAAWWGAAGAG